MKHRSNNHRIENVTKYRLSVVTRCDHAAAAAAAAAVRRRMMVSLIDWGIGIGVLE